MLSPAVQAAIPSIKPLPKHNIPAIMLNTGDVTMEKATAAPAENPVPLGVDHIGAHGHLNREPVKGSDKTS